MVSEKLDRANEPPKWMKVYVTQNATAHVGHSPLHIIFARLTPRIAAGYDVPVVIPIEGNIDDHFSTSGVLHCQILDGGIPECGIYCFPP